MPLSLSQREQPDLFSSLHHKMCPVHEERHEIVLSGIAAVGFRGSTRDGWYRDTMSLHIDLGSAIDQAHRRSSPAADTSGASRPNNGPPWSR